MTSSPYLDAGFPTEVCGVRELVGVEAELWVAGLWDVHAGAIGGGLPHCGLLWRIGNVRGQMVEVRC